MKLSALDLMNMGQQETTAEKFSRTIELAKHLDKLGYRRMWFAEHHGITSNVSSAPEITASVIAGLTENIHVGTGGTMIMHYSPLKIAEQFKTLSAFAPGRVDFGIGRAPGGDKRAILSMSQGKDVHIDDLYEKIEIILDYLKDEKPINPLYGHIAASPQNLETLPEAWLLGSSGNSAIRAGEMGLSYNFATFFGVTSDRTIFDLYRQRFVPSEFHSEPNVMSAYQVVVADTDEEADYLARPQEIGRILQRQNRFEATLSPEVAKDYNLTKLDEMHIQNDLDKRILVKGSKETVAAILSDEQDKYGFDEVMVYSPITDHQARLKSYTLLMETLGKNDQ